MRLVRRVGAAALVAVAAVTVAVAVQPAAEAATTIRVNSLTPYQMIKPGSVTVSGTTTGSPDGETVRLLFQNDLKLTVPVVDGRFSGTFDTGPLVDGIYTIYADVPDGNGYQFSAGTVVYVDEDPDDIVVSSPAAGATVSSFTPDGLVITGRVADPGLIQRVAPNLGPRSLLGLGTSVAEDGTFRIFVPAQDVPQGSLRVAVFPLDCLDWTTCGALGTSPVTISAKPSATITSPVAGSNYAAGDSLISLGLRVTDPGPDDVVSGLLDGKFAVNMQTPIRQKPTESLYWTNVPVRDLGQGRHTLHVTATIRGVAVPVADVGFTVDLSPPTVPALTAPATSLTASAAVAWTATDEAGIGGYDVRWRTTSAIQATSGYGYPSSLQNTTATRSTVALAAGKSYCFSARARDIAARTSDWSAERCTLAPFDDRWLTVSKGAKRVAFPGFLSATATSLPAKGTASHTGVTATQVGVVARACPACGTMTVTLGGAKLGTVSLKSAKATRVVVWLPAGTRRTGTLTLTAPAGATLDGVFVRR